MPLVSDAIGSTIAEVAPRDLSWKVRCALTSTRILGPLVSEARRSATAGMELKDLSWQVRYANPCLDSDAPTLGGAMGTAAAGVALKGLSWKVRCATLASTETTPLCPTVGERCTGAPEWEQRPSRGIHPLCPPLQTLSCQPGRTFGAPGGRQGTAGRNNCRRTSHGPARMTPKDLSWKVRCTTLALTQEPGPLVGGAMGTAAAGVALKGLS